MTDTSESFGLPQTADFFFALIENEELATAGQLMVKQLKNRGNDTTKNKTHPITIRSRASSGYVNELFIHHLLLKYEFYDVRWILDEDTSPAGQASQKIFYTLINAQFDVSSKNEVRYCQIYLWADVTNLSNGCHDIF